IACYEGPSSVLSRLGGWRRPKIARDRHDNLLRLALASGNWLAACWARQVYAGAPRRRRTAPERTLVHVCGSFGVATAQYDLGQFCAMAGKLEACTEEG